MVPAAPEGRGAPGDEGERVHRETCLALLTFRTARHQHPVPVFVYVLEGTLTVQADGEQPREYTSGKAFIEDVNHWHQAFNKGTAPVKILVVFMGEEGKPTTINAK